VTPLADGVPAVAAGTAVAASLAALLTGRVRRFALAHGVLDVPNQRSAHTRPTPRGGGLALVVATLVAWIGGAALGWLDLRLLMAAGVGGALVAAVGWVDDRTNLRPLVRFAAQLAAAGWAIGWLTWPELTGPGLGWLGLVRMIGQMLGVVWLTNLYNFMDGIDGLAAAEGLLVGGFGAGLGLMLGAPAIGFASAVLAAAAAGFLGWNWPPAKIFMGDVGSGFLGFGFGVITVASAAGPGPSALVWAILLMAFLFDATVTLLRRIGRREVWYEAHRSHAYQRAALGGVGHREVTRLVVGLDLGFGAVALAVTAGPIPPWAGLAVAGLAAAAAYRWVERRWPM
jgi:glycosyltransferase WbpL